MNYVICTYLGIILGIILAVVLWKIIPQIRYKRMTEKADLSDTSSVNKAIVGFIAILIALVASRFVRI